MVLSAAPFDCIDVEDGYPKESPDKEAAKCVEHPQFSENKLSQAIDLKAVRKGGDNELITPFGA